MACSRCSFRFTQDAPSQEEIGPYYDTDSYVEHSDTRSGLVFTLYHYGRMLMLNMKLRLIKRTHSGKRLLDIGSASGYFLNHMKLGGYQVKGVEINEKARALCKEKFDIDSYPPEWLTEQKDAKFDLISLWHVFEHVYDYDGYFKAFDNLLTDDGRIVVAMPNYRAYDASYYGKYWNAYDVPRHIWHFDFDSFSQFAKDRGFEIEKVKDLPLDPFYNAMTSAEFKPKFTFIPWALFIGFVAYLKGVLNTKKASSIVYILKKTN